MRDDEQQKVRELIAFSTGVGVEDISLHNMVFYDPYAPSVPVVVEPGVPEGLQLRDMLIYGGIGLSVLAILIFVISIILRKRRKKKEAEKQAAIAEAAATDGFSWADIQDEIKLQETPEQVIKKQLKDFTSTNPEIAAQLIRTWLKGEE